MTLSPTLSRYLAKNYFLNVMFMMGVLLGIVYLFDTVELLRRASKRNDIPLSLILEMGFLKLPEVGQIIFPFAILFSAMFTFWQLTRRYELIVVRAAGFSVWQFLAPVMAVAILIGILQVTVINPVGATLLSKFETLENEHLSHRRNYVALFKEGLWLRQAEEQSYVILHAENIKLPDWELRNVMVLFFDTDDVFKKRIDAKTAKLKDGMWIFEKAQIHQPTEKSESVPLIALPTELTIKEIEESFASPETISFWNLPSFIQTMESTGFNATRLKIHFQSLLSQPLLFSAMILLAASVSLRPPRLRGTLALVIMGIMIGFLVFFLSSFLQALGTSGQIPVILAAWSPALVTFLLGVAVMLNLEDG